MRISGLAVAYSGTCGATYLFDKIHEGPLLLGDPVPDQVFLTEITDALDAINYLHPFREGNGRTQRAFLDQVAAGTKGMSDEPLLELAATTSHQLRSLQAEVRRLARLRREQVGQLRANGVSYQTIADRLEVTRSAVQQIVRRSARADDQEQVSSATTATSQ